MEVVRERTKNLFKELVKILQPPENLNIQEWAFLPKEGAAGQKLSEIESKINFLV